MKKFVYPPSPPQYHTVIIVQVGEGKQPWKRTHVKEDEDKAVALYREKLRAGYDLVEYTVRRERIKEEVEE